MLLFSASAMPVISPEFDFAFLARVWARGSGQTLPIVLDRKKKQPHCGSMLVSELAPFRSNGAFIASHRIKSFCIGG